MLTCWYAWKQSASNRDVECICSKFKPYIQHKKRLEKYSTVTIHCNMHVSITNSAWLLTADCKALGANFTPSVRKVIGAKRANDMTVMIDKRLMLSRGSCRSEEGGKGICG